MPSRLRTLNELDASGKRVLVRVDYNVPMNDGAMSDDSRLRATLPTLQHLLNRRAAVVICSHLGRPDGKVVETLRLAPIARRLSQMLDRPVATVSDCIGPEVEAAVAALRPGQALLLENLRFHPEEERNDPVFARGLAALADLYVNDAFATAHRAHASTEGVAHLLPSAAGFLMEKEVSSLSRLLQEPARPFATIIGGAKVSTKATVLEHLLQRVDALLVGGGMACTFLAAEGYEMGRSLVEKEVLPTARDFINAARQRGVSLLLPSDAVVVRELKAHAPHETVGIAEVGPDQMMVDIGPDTVRQFREMLQRSRTVFWNGPLGVFEMPPFDQGTRLVAEAMAGLDAVTMVGGGETVAAVEQAGLAWRFTHVSTGGGASLEFLEGRTLPGVAALMQATT